MASDLKAGFARCDITPELGTRLGGYGIEERPAENIQDALRANVVVLEQGGVMSCIVSLDLLGLEEVDCDTIRRGIEAATGVPAAQVIVSCSHTHSGPCSYTVWGWGDKVAPYLASIVAPIVSTATEAVAAMEPVRVGIAMTQSDTGVCRQGIGVGHSVSLFADVRGSYDPTMTIIRLRGATDDVVTLVHYGAHPTAYGATRDVSRDWPGIMTDRLEKQAKSPVMFVQGTLGDVGPRTSRMLTMGSAENRPQLSAGTGDGWEAVLEVGYRAAYDLISTWQKIRDFRDDLTLGKYEFDFQMPYAPLASAEEAELELAKMGDGPVAWGAAMCDHTYWQAVLAAHRKPQPESYRFAQTIIQLGPIVLVPLPGEVFSAIGLRLRASSPFEHTLSLSQANGSMGYICTRESRHRGCYANWVNRAFSAYQLADTIDDAIVEQHVAALCQLAGGA